MASLDGWIDAHTGTDRIAFRFEDETVTYDQLAERIVDAARGLEELGVEVGDRVVWCGLNRVELFETLFACARLGAVFVPLNNRLTPTELAIQVDKADPVCILVTDGFQDAFANVGGGRVVRDLDASPFGMDTDTGAPTGGDAVPARAGGDELPCLMVFTSGTTGEPKGAVLSQRALRLTAENSIDHQGFTADDVVIAPLPTFHVGGLNIQTLPVLLAGGEVVLMRRFEPGVTLELIRAHRPTQTLLVPAMLRAVAEHPDFDTTDVSCLVGINTGSSVVPEAVMQPFFDRGVPVGQVYGATETGPTSIVLRYDEAADHLRSCGRAALHTEVRIVDPNGDDMPIGQAGEVVLKGGNLFTEYWRNPQATADAFFGDWYRTGDVGHIDEDGYVTISDRLRDMVISGGENIYPAEVESVLIEHEAIVDVAIIGEPDERWGEIPVAVAVVAMPLELDELRSWAETRLARFKLPRKLVVVDDLPRTALGKVQKHHLRTR